MWDYKNSPFLSQFNLLVREHSGGNMRLAVDKIMMVGLRALKNLDFELMEGEELTKKGFVIKGPDEIKAMRCASHACETAVRAMGVAAPAGVPKGQMSEDDIRVVQHAENIRRGGEWIETRLLASGPHTNPWFQECGPRLVQNNEIVSFDTDLIGSYGICVDISRRWWIGDLAPPPDMISAVKYAHAHIHTNTQFLAPGVSMRSLSENGHLLQDRYQVQKYGCMMHGVGLCDEWPLIAYSDQLLDGAFEYELEADMVLCVEALISPEGGDFSIKLEDQVLITEDGF